MPQIDSAKKALRQTRTRTAGNRKVKTQIKKRADLFLKKPQASLLSELFSALDKAAKIKLFHKNKTNRLKSQYSKKLKPATAQSPPFKKPSKSSSTPAAKATIPKPQTKKK